jgi:hypothetical protein
MAQITKLAQLINGFPENQDLASNELVVDSVTLGGGSGTNLTKAQLDTLISNSHASGSDNQNITAGTGLSGGGSGATPTLNVGDVNKGVQVNADDLQVDASEISGDGLEQTSGVGNEHLLTVKLDGATLTKSAFGLKVTDNTYILQSTKGAANGVAELDGSGKLPTAQLPASAMEYKGAHNVSTNSPALIDGTGTNGDLYRVSVGGTRDYGSGNITLAAGDALIYNGSIWEKIPSEDLVQSVAGKTGVVTLDTDDVSEATNLYYTDGRFDTRFATKDSADLNHTQADAGDWTVGTGASMAAHLDELADRTTTLEADNVSDAVTKTMVAGEAFAINTSVAVRMAVNGETAGRLYKIDTASSSKCHAIGMVHPTSAISAGQNIDVTMLGEIDSSVDFTATQDEGLPVFVTAAGGAPTVTPPSSGFFSIIGTVQTVGVGTSKIMIQAPRYGGKA